MKKLSSLSMVILLMGLVFACSKDKSSDNDKSGPQRRLNTKNFKNTTDKETFYQKGEKSRNVFGNLQAVRSDFGLGGGEQPGVRYLANSASNANVYDYDKLKNCQIVRQSHDAYGNVVTEEKCEVETDAGETLSCDVETIHETSGVTQQTVSCSASSTAQSSTSEIGRFQPSLTNVEDCNGAFEGFESLYAGARTQFNEIFEMLKRTQGASIAGTSLSETSPDDRSAIAFEFSSDPQTPDIDVKGSISGGANDDLLVLNMNLDLKAQSSHVSQKIEVASDLANEIIEVVFDIQVEEAGDAPQAIKSSGVIAISGGKEKWVESSVSVLASQPKGKNIKMNVAASAKLVDENKMALQMKANNNGEAQNVAFEILRDANGTCKIEKK